MACTAPSWPPSPSDEPRRPGLKSTKPQRYEDMLLARDVVLDLVRRFAISERELAECWGVTPKVARDKLKGELPIHLGEAFALPRRIRLEANAAIAAAFARSARVQKTA
jgi:hypothetical protein